VHLDLTRCIAHVIGLRIFASWASSAPVNAQVNMSSYYGAVERGIPQNCSADFAAAIQFFDSSVTSSNASLVSEVKNGVASAIAGQTVSARSSDGLDAPTVGEYLLAPFSNFQSGGPKAIQPFCDYLETAGGQSTPTSAGLAATMPQEQVFSIVLKSIQAVLASETSDSTSGKLDAITTGDKRPIAAGSTGAPSAASSIPPDTISWEYQVRKRRYSGSLSDMSDLLF
jgi:hypothetical protein